MSAPVNGLGPVDLRLLCEIFTKCKVTRKVVRWEGINSIEVFKMIPKNHVLVKNELYRIYSPFGLDVIAPLYWLFVPQCISIDELRKWILRWVYSDHIPAGQNGSDISWLTYENLAKMPCDPYFLPRATLVWTGQEELLVRFLSYIRSFDRDPRRDQFKTRYHYAWRYWHYWSDPSGILPQILYPITNCDNESPVLPIPIFQQARRYSTIRPPILTEQQAFQNTNPPQDHESSFIQHEQEQNQIWHQNLNAGRLQYAPGTELPEPTVTPLPTQLRAPSLVNLEAANQAALIRARRLDRNTLTKCSIYFSATKKLITKCIVQGWPDKPDKRRPVLQINFPINYFASKALRRVFPKMRMEDWKPTRKSIRTRTLETDVAFFLRLHLDDIKTIAVLNDFQVVIGCTKQNGFCKIAFHSSPGQAPIWPFIQWFVLVRGGFENYKDPFFEKIAEFIDRGYTTVSYWYKWSGLIRQGQQAQVHAQDQGQGQAEHRVLPTAQEEAQQVPQRCPAPILDDLRSDYKKAIYVLARLILHNADKVTKAPCEQKVYDHLHKLKSLLDSAIERYNEYASVGRQEDELLRCIDDPLWALRPESNKTPTPDLANAFINEPVLEYEGACMIFRSRRCQWQSCTVKWKFTLDEQNCDHLELATQYNPNDKAMVEGYVNGKLFITIHRKRILYYTLEGNQLYKGDQHGLTIHCLSEYFQLRFSSFQDYKRFGINFCATLGVREECNYDFEITSDEVDTMIKIWALSKKSPELLFYRVLFRNINPTSQLNGKIKAKISKLMAHNIKWLSFKLLNRYALKLAVDLNVNAIVQDRSLNAKQVESVQAFTDAYYHASQWYHIPAGELASCDCCYCKQLIEDAQDEVIRLYGSLDETKTKILAMSRLAFKYELLICLNECSYFDDPV